MDSPGYIKGIVNYPSVRNGANWNSRQEPIKSDYGVSQTQYHPGISEEGTKHHLNQHLLMINQMPLVIMAM